MVTLQYLGFCGGSDSKESACNAGDLGSIPGLGRSPAEENGNPLQYSCLEILTAYGEWCCQIRGLGRRRFNSGTKDNLSYSELCVDFIKVTGIEKASNRRPWKWEESTRLTPLSGPYIPLN